MLRLSLLGALALCAASCVSKSEEPPAALSEGCLINSDCASPLVCAFRRCHTQCDTVRDCPMGLECVPADRPFNVCLLPDETCRSQPCPSGLTCGADALCRAACGDDSTCLAEQSCVNGGVCASGLFLVEGRLPAASDAGAATCVRNSDCPQNLVCLAGSCRVECFENRDCAPGLTCELDTGLCVLPTPTNLTVPPTWSFVCAIDDDCWNGLGAPPVDGGVLTSDDPRTLICGPSSRCTYECTQGRQCVSGVCSDFHCAPIQQGGTGGGAGGGGGGGTGTGGGGGTVVLPDGGTVPMAIVGPTQTVAPGAVVTLTGFASTGEGPLSYAWTQRMGTTVVLSANSSPTAFQPTFTAPSTPQVLRFELVVTDASNRVSTAASTSVIVGGAPTARFTPDGGLFGGGSLVQLISTSYDDAGLALTTHEWQLLAGSVGTVTSDGGATALLQLSNPTLAEGDALAVVQLRVTNAIGVVSAPTQRSFTTRNASGENWVLTARTPTSSVNYTGAPTTVQLTAGIDAGVSAPSVTYSWSCSPGVAVVGADSSTASYVVPVVQGAAKNVVCTVTAAGLPPLNPPTRSATVNTLVFDVKGPTLLDNGIVGGHESIIGHLMTFDEPLENRFSFGASSYCVGAQGTAAGEVINDSILFSSYGPLVPETTCNRYTLAINDLAGNPTTSTAGSPSLVSMLWEGPWVSSATFADPRPLFITLTQTPWAQARRFTAMTPGVQPYELIAREGSSLVRFAFDPLATPPTCTTSCAMTAQTQSIASLAAALPIGAEARTGVDGLSSFLSMPTVDGGTLVLERNLAGTWAENTAFSGPISVVQRGLGQARVNAQNQLLAERYDRTTNTFPVQEIISAAGGPIDVFEVSDDINTSGLPTGGALVHRAGGTWEGYTRTGTNLWASRSVGGFAADTLTARPVGLDPFLITSRSVSAPFLAIRSMTGPSAALANNAAPVGYDMVRRGPIVYVVASELGDIRLYGVGFNGNGVGNLVVYGYPGPPRGAVIPAPTALDLDPACEAAWPRINLVHDAMIITWQERCSSGGPWNVVSRVVH